MVYSISDACDKILQKQLQNIPTNILLYMHYNNITRHDLVSIFKISKSTISKYLNCDININKFLKRFCEYYKMKQVLFKIPPINFIKYLEENITEEQAITLSKQDIKLNHLINNNNDFKNIINDHHITVLANEETRTVIDDFKNEIIGLKEQLKRSDNKTDTLQQEVSELKQLIIQLLNQNKYI